MKLQCVELDVGGAVLLVPLRCVAQLVPDPEVGESSLSEPFLLGILSWLDRRIALLDWQALSGGPAGGFTPKLVAVFADSQFDGRYYALALASEALRVDIAPGELTDVSGEPVKGALARVERMGRELLIPDLRYTERVLGRMLSG